jgi:peptidoglycan/LPS O-acetylase OafA/YrhL
MPEPGPAPIAVDTTPGRFVVLDSWRGIAALLVAFYHFSFQWHFYDASVIRNAWLCVDFFFVLSGFVLAHAYGDKVAGGRDLGAFVIRRTGRMWPLHVVTLAAAVAPWARSRAGSLLTGTDFKDSGENTLYSILTNLLLIHSLGIHNSATWNAPSWTISTEYYTNILYGLVVLLFGRFQAGAALLLAIGGVVAVIALANGNMETSVDYGIFRCMYGFFTGTLVYLVFQNAQAPRLMPNSVASALELVTIVLAFAFLARAGASSLALFAPLLFGLVVLVFAYGRGMVSRLLRQRTFVTIGTLSYSIYMTHGLVALWFYLGVMAFGSRLPIEVAARPADGSMQGNVWALDVLAGVYIAVIIGASALTYRYVEQPWRRRFNQMARALEAGGWRRQNAPLRES